MNIKKQSQIDELGFKILKELQANARSTFSDIGRKVGLSSPAVAERVYKMEAAGIITGYHAHIDPDVLGYNIRAFITLTTEARRYTDIFTFLESENEVLECHHVSGNESLILKVATPSIPRLDRLIEKLSRYGETKSAIVLSSPVQKKVVEPL